MISEIRTANAVSGPPDVLAALQQASAKTGSDFDYLLGTAMRESSLKTQAKSAHSSATGLFQFIDQTWLGLVKRFGGSHGLGQFSDAIRETGNGRYNVGSAEMKSAILALRKDPAISALMAGEAASETKQGMEASLGRQVSCGELYAAHFLGQGSACRLIALNEANPNQRADLAFPQAANANRSVFYAADGTAKTVGEVYNWAIQLPDGASSTRPARSAGVPAQAAPAAASTRLRSAFDVAAQSPDTDTTQYWRTHRKDGEDRKTDAAPVHFSPLASRVFAPAGLPQTAGLVLTPGVIEILASLDAGTAFATGRRAS